VTIGPVSVEFAHCYEGWSGDLNGFLAVNGPSSRTQFRDLSPFRNPSTAAAMPSAAYLIRLVQALTPETEGDGS
jgi:hypothetical protein